MFFRASNIHSITLRAKIKVCKEVSLYLNKIQPDTVGCTFIAQANVKVGRLQFILPCCRET